MTRPGWRPIDREDALYPALRPLALLLLLAACGAAAQAPLVLTPGQPAPLVSAHAVAAPAGTDRYAPVRTLVPGVDPAPGVPPPAYRARVVLRSGADRPTRWLLPLALGRVTAEIRRADGRRETVRTGLDVPVARRPAVAGPVPVVPVHLGPRETVTLTLDVRHDPQRYTEEVPDRPAEAAAYLLADQRQAFWLAMTLGILLALAVYNVFLLATFRDASYLWYVLFLAGTGVYWAEQRGLLSGALWTGQAWIAEPASFFGLVVAAAAYGTFVRGFLQTRVHAPRLDRTVRVVVGGWALAAALGAAGLWPAATTVAAVSGLALLVFCVSAGVVTARAGFLPARAYLLAAGPFLLVGAGYIAVFLAAPAWLAAARVWLQGAMVAETLLLAMALSARIRMLQTDRSRAERGRERAEAAAEVHRQADALKTRLLGIAAHDLRNPLTTILGATDLVDDEAPAAREATALIRDGARRMLALLDDLLVTSALDERRVTLHRSVQDVAALAEEAVRSFGMQAAAKQQTIHYERPPQPLRADVDGTRIRAVLDNLISNAVKYAPVGGAIHVACARHGGTVRVAVRDSGPGLSAGDRAHLFERFRPLSSVPTGGESSTGLGLSIAMDFARLHRGTIEVSDAPGGGAVFALVLPAAATRRARGPARGVRA